MDLIFIISSKTIFQENGKLKKVYFLYLIYNDLYHIDDMQLYVT